MSTTIPPAGEVPSLASVAGRWTTLLGGVGAPLYGVGAIVTHGVARWVMLGIFVQLLIAVCLPQRTPTRRESPFTLTLCVGAVVLWGTLAAEQTALRAVALTVGIVYLALMALRPYAEIGLVLMPAAHLGTYLLVARGGGLSWQVAGVAATATALGALLLGIRVTTERRFGDRTRALAAANAQLEDLARVDPLTGMANKRRLGEVLDSMCAYAGRAGKPVSVIMIDIDHFKQYNDHYGHLRGDACLQAVATALAGSVRDGDLVARFGGEEFSIVLAGTGPDEALAIAERARAAVAGLAEEHAGAPRGIVTISAGVSTVLPAGADGPGEDLLRRADTALYAAKRDGRNRVVAGVLTP
jgi:diguanylate cyclase (GGDEF)-like protein